MNTSRLHSQVLLKGILVVVPLLLAFQSIGGKALSNLRSAPGVFLEGESPPALTCTSPSYCNVQLVLLIDDSGSMRINDAQDNRQKAAMHLMDALAIRYYALAAKAQNTNSALPNVQVAIVHFSNQILSNSGWLQIHPGSRAEWEAQRTSLFGMIEPRETVHEADGTLFEGAFREAADLFQSGEGQAPGGPCERRTILLFSDGTPEDLKYGIFQTNDLDAEMDKVREAVGQIPGLDGIYATVFKLNSRYWNKAIEEHWLKVVGSPSPYELPPVVVIDRKDYFVQLTRRMEEIAASLNDVKPDRASMDLSQYQGLRVELEDQPAPVQRGAPSQVRFKLLNDSGSIVTTGGDAASALKLDVTVSQMAQDSSLNLTQDGEDYQLSWTPAGLGEDQFKVVANLLDASGAVLLNCAGIINVPIEDPPDSEPIILSLLIGSPRFPNQQTVTLPMKMNYKGTASQIDSLKWNHTAKNMDNGQTLKTTVQPSGTQPGEYELTVESIGKASTIQVAVSMIAGIGNRTITSPEAATTVEIPINPPICHCDTLSVLWFWPLAILLSGLLILLLALRIWPQWTEIDVQGERRYLIRNSDWHVLFLPFLGLLALLIVNRLWWCCVLPPWLFLVLALLPIAFWLLTNPWYRKPVIGPAIGPLSWVVGAADDSGAELSLQADAKDDKPAPVPAPAPGISLITAAPVTWALRDESEIDEEVRVSSRS